MIIIMLRVRISILMNKMILISFRISTSSHQISNMGWMKMKNNSMNSSSMNSSSMNSNSNNSMNSNSMNSNNMNSNNMNNNKN